MNQDNKKKVLRETLSLYPNDWAIVEHVMKQFNLKRSQAMRVILNDYRSRHISGISPTNQQSNNDGETK